MEAPADAMLLLSDPAFSKHYFEIAITIGKHNFSLAPDRHNRIPNFQERHDQMLEAIEVSTLTEEMKDSYRQAAAKDFHRKLNQAHPAL